MKRRNFLAAALAASAVPALSRATSGVMQTQWTVDVSEGLDAVAFLGALSGGDLYLRYYADAARIFGDRMPKAQRDDLVALAREAESTEFGLLWPSLVTVVSGVDCSTIDKVIAALSDPAARLLPAYRASVYWDDKQWALFTAMAPRLATIFTAMRDAGFSAFRREQAGPDLPSRAAEVERALARHDVVRWQRKLTGRDFDPQIAVTLMQFSKPHGVKAQGQHFLQAADYDIATTVRIAAHEMMHPPVALDGPAAQAAIAVLEKDALMVRIVRDHDPRWGYTTLIGYLDEDLCEALDQMIAENLGVAVDPAERWRKADDGMHVLAAGLYGLLREDRWAEDGGSIEAWLEQAATGGRLSPAVLHPVAARILKRPIDGLWPLVPEST